MSKNKEQNEENLYKLKTKSVDELVSILKDENVRFVRARPQVNLSLGEASSSSPCFR